MLFKDGHQFFTRICMLRSESAFEELGIEPCAAFGMFGSDRVPELLAFCKSRPEFHIVTQLNANVIVNRFSPAGRTFSLASGDPDPRLICDSTAMDPDLEILEFRTDKAAS